MKTAFYNKQITKVEAAKIVKSIFAALLLFVLLLCSCGTSPEESDEIETTDGMVEETSGETESTLTDSSAPDTGYLLIDRVEPTNYTTSCFAAEGSELGISLRLPGDWRFEKQSKSVFKIYTNGRHIGNVIFGSDGKDSDWKELLSDFTASGDQDINISVEKSTSSGAYRHRICFAFSENGEAQRITFTVDYQELSEAAINKIKVYAQCKRVGSDPQFGIIDIENSTSDRVLIMGNSFIYSSKVGSILQEMIDRNGRNTVVDHISIGYALVETFAYDELIIDDIRSGVYGAVFICGFYSNDQATHLAVLKKACDASGTPLVMFPAHNEQEASVKYAYKKVKGVYLLNWKDEVQAFINNGASKWEFCIDDQHLHSTPMAGYVGAHMIYRAIYGEVPGGSVSQFVSQSDVKRILGDYIRTGIIYEAGDSNTYLFG